MINFVLQKVSGTGIKKCSYHFTFYSLNLSLNGILLMSFFSIQIFLVWVFWKSISDNLFSWNSIWLFFIPLNSGAIEQKQFYLHHFHSNLKVTIISMKLWCIDIRMDGYHTLSKWEDLRIFKPSTNYYPGTCNHLTSLREPNVFVRSFGGCLRLLWRMDVNEAITWFTQIVKGQGQPRL